MREYLFFLEKFTTSSTSFCPRVLSEMSLDDLNDDCASVEREAFDDSISYPLLKAAYWELLSSVKASEAILCKWSPGGPISRVRQAE